MLEPISDSRRSLLLSLNLCTAADLRRAGRHVRRLARDLPAFDSVWLDALVQMGRITPFQARILESSRPDRIRIGPCRLIERLGGGPLGETFLASTGRGHTLCVVKQLSAIERLSAEAEERLTSLIESLRGVDHPSIAAPFTCERVGEELVVASRHVGGLHLGELLVRRGRFPPGVVWEIARQLADGLHALEKRSVVHGDLRAANVRLTKAGVAVLVDIGTRAAVDPELSVHSGLPPDRYDGVAPELIGAVASPTTASDMYALGCLLWQLLAGRPPFPGGDPLVKLAAHQTRSIDNVRQWAPETPQPLAEGIRRLTSRDPADRPASFAEVLERWGAPDWRGRRRLAAFRRWFDAPAPMRIEPAIRSRGPRWSILAGMLALTLMVAGALQHNGARTVLVSWRARLTAALPEEASGAGVQTFRPEPAEAPATELITDETDDGLMEIPSPDLQGVVRLKARGQYRAKEIATVGALKFISEGPAPAEIVIRAKSLKLTAETVHLENVQLRHDSASAVRRASRTALVHVQSQILQLDRCVLMASELPTTSATSNDSRAAATEAGVVWKLVDARDPQGGHAAMRNSLLVGGDSAIEIVEPVHRIEIVNCLRLTGGALVQVAIPPAARSETLLRLDRTTCRGVKSLLRLPDSSGAIPRGKLTVDANDCVLDLSPSDGCLFELPGETAAEGPPRIKLTGEGSLAPETVVTARRRTPKGASVDVDLSDIPVEGILAGPYRFAGPLSLRPADAEIRSYNAPRRSTFPPGIEATSLPTTLR